jgi:hypothetical protein
MMADLIYNSFLEYLANGVIDLENAEFMCAILGAAYTPDRDADDNWGDISAHEVSGVGYTPGGQALANKVLTKDNAGDLVKFDADNPVWPTVTFTDGRWAVIYKNAVADANKKLIGAWDFGSNKSPTAVLFTAIINANGLFRLKQGT